MFLGNKRKHKRFWAEFLQAAPEFNQLSKVFVGASFDLLMLFPNILILPHCLSI